MIYDISRTLRPTLAVWPGDTPFSLQRVASKDEGAAVNLTTLTLSAHTGSHADAPWHYDSNGERIGDVALNAYIGPCHLIHITRELGGITPEDFAWKDISGLERLLIKTWVSDLPDDQWPEEFPYPTPELIDWLASQGCILLGVDMPSMDPQDSKTLDGHHALRRHGMLNLETLYLHEIPEGHYELIALPLKIAGGCGSPVRAILRSLP